MKKAMEGFRDRFQPTETGPSEADKKAEEAKKSGDYKKSGEDKKSDNGQKSEGNNNETQELNTKDGEH